MSNYINDGLANIINFIHKYVYVYKICYSVHAVVIVIWNRKQLLLLKDYGI